MFYRCSFYGWKYTCLLAVEHPNIILYCKLGINGYYTAFILIKSRAFVNIICSSKFVVSNSRDRIACIIVIVCWKDPSYFSMTEFYTTCSTSSMESRFGILDGYLRTWAQLVTKFQSISMYMNMIIISCLWFYTPWGIFSLHQVVTPSYKTSNYTSSTEVDTFFRVF